jgi:hypothetical protein
LSTGLKSLAPHSWPFDWRFSVLLLAGAALRLPWMGAEGYAGDARQVADQVAAVAAHGFGRAYEYAYEYQPGGAAGLLYGPFYATVSGGVAALWMRLAAALGVAAVPLPLPVFKLPMVAADLSIGWLIFLSARRLRSPNAALGFAAMHLLNPGMVLVSSWWGQTDPLATLCITAALIALTTGRAAGASLASTCAVLTKAQAYFIAPLTALVLARERRPDAVMRAAVTVAGTVLLLCTPLLVEGQVTSLPLMYVKLVDRHATVHVNAFNVWWLKWGWLGNSVPDSATLIGPASYKQVGLLLVVLYSALLLWRFWTRYDRRDVALVATCLSAAFFLLPTQIHSRYLYPALPLLLLAAIQRPRLLGCYTVLSVTFFLNQLHLILRSAGPPPAWLDDTERLGLSTTALAVANLLTFAVLTWVATGTPTALRRLTLTLIRRKSRPLPGGLALR